jgi:RNA polymerase sigma-70 factor (ECF subfamily)
MGLDQDTAVRLILSHRGKAIGYISSILGDTHLAEDVFQDVAVLTLRKAASIEGEEAFPGWLFKTARFLALNALRKSRRMPQPLDDSVLDLLDQEWAAGEGEPDNQAALDALHSCLEKLTDRARHLVGLRYGNEMSGQTLAESLGQPLNTVYVALSRIHRALAKCVQGELNRERTADV